MNKYISKLLSLTIIAFFAVFALNIYAEMIITPQQMSVQPTLIPTPPSITANGYILLDANSGYVIAEKNSNVKMSPASLTKIMSLYVVADTLKSGRIHLTDPVHVSENAWRTGGSRMFIQVGTDIPVSTLIQGIAIASGNDATVAMAEYIAGSEDSFANLMNQTAARLNMADTHFSDSNGLPSPNHYTTPSDLARLARAWIHNFPEYYSWFGQKWFIFNNIKQPNRNRLLWRDPSVDGMKTGHTDDAGYCLVASAQRNGMRLISVILGAPSDKVRANDSQALLNYGFRFFETHKIYDANKPISSVRTWFGTNKNTSLGISSDFYVTVPVGQYKNIKVTVTQSQQALQAPIAKGKQYGVVTVWAQDKKIAEHPLAALQDNPEGGFFSRLIDHIALLFHGWFN